MCIGGVGEGKHYQNTFYEKDFLNKKTFRLKRRHVKNSNKSNFNICCTYFDLSIICLKIYWMVDYCVLTTKQWMSDEPITQVDLSIPLLHK